MELLVSWLPDPEQQPFWPDLYRMLEPAARVGNCAVLDEGDLVWVAVLDGLLLGAATTRLLVNGETELKHVAGGEFRRWYAQLEAVICQWSRDCGAKVIRSRGRHGWAPIVSKLGWTVTGRENGLILYAKEL